MAIATDMCMLNVNSFFTGVGSSVSVERPDSTDIRKEQNHQQNHDKHMCVIPKNLFCLNLELQSKYMSLVFIKIIDEC